MIRVVACFSVLAVIAVLLLLGAYGVIGGAYREAGAPVTQPEISTPRPDPEQPIRILLVGTSLTAGGNWPALLEKWLAACRAGALVVERLAKPGKAIRWGKPALTQRLKTGPRPDLIVMEFAINDAVLLRGLPLVMARSRTQAVIDQIASAGIPLYLATMNPAWGREALERPGQHRYFAAYRDLAAANKLGLIDTVPLWNALPLAQRRKLVPDNLHPNDEGMKVVALPVITNALSEHVCS